MPVPFERCEPEAAGLIGEKLERSEARIACSVVVPVFNEAVVIGSVLSELRQVLANHQLPTEVLVVDDGSTDGTDRVVAQVLAGWAGAHLLRLARNGGQAGALYHGIQRAQGQAIVLMDGDGQNDPADIPKLLGLLNQADMAMGIRVNRKDSWTRRVMSRLANRVRRRILNDGVSDTGCGLKVFRHRVKEAFIPFQTLYSFMPALAVAAGFTVVEAPVSHRPRQGGRSNYGVRQFLWRPLLDLIGVWWFCQRRCVVLPQPEPSKPVSFPAGPVRHPMPSGEMPGAESCGLVGEPVDQRSRPAEPGRGLASPTSPRLTAGL
ncbi:MAG TPA: glycosyltransferase family 2 protein [Chthoniobacterales bacterium]